MSVYPSPSSSSPTTGGAGIPAASVPFPILASLCRLAASAEGYRRRAVSWNEFDKRGDIKPAVKVLARAMGRHLGFGPESPPASGQKAEWRTLYRSQLSSETGICEDDITDHWQAMVEAKWLRMRPDWQKDPLTKVPHRVNQFSWPTGLDWERTWGDPAHLPPIDRPLKRQEAAKARAEKKRTAEDVRPGSAATALAPVPDRPAEALACPFCGGVDCMVHCRECQADFPLSKASSARKAHGDDSSPSSFTPNSVLPTPLSDGGPGGSEQVHQPFPTGDGFSVPDDGDDSSPWGIATEDRDVHSDSFTLIGGESSPSSEGSQEWESDYGPAEDEDALPLVLPSAPEALEAAARLIAPAVLPFPNHIEMTGKAEPKYLTVPAPLTPELIGAHLAGEAVLGGGLYWPDTNRASGRAARAIAWDSDGDFGRLIHAGCQLRRHGLIPLLCKNPSKPASGHLWLFFDSDVDPSEAFAVCEHLAPGLADVPERFPNPKATDGRRIRLPGGRYLPPGKAPVDVLVALAPRYGPPSWYSGVGVEGHVTISRATTGAGCLSARWVPPERRYTRTATRASTVAPPPTRPVPLRAGGPQAAAGSAFFRDWCAAHPISSMVPLERRGRREYFKAPWRSEKTASVEVFDDGHWHDYGPDARHGVDAFDLWCAIEGHWDHANNRPDRKAAYRRLRGEQKR